MTLSVIAAENADGTLSVMVTPPSGTSVASFELAASYLDLTSGEEQSIPATVLSTSNTLCTGAIYSPPLDIPVTITASINAGAPSAAQGSVVATVSSRGAIILTNADDGFSVVIPFNPEWSDSYSPNVEVADAIAGRSLPPIYLGEGGSRTISVSGYIRARDYLRADYLLSIPAHWVMRAPHGVRRVGTITKFSLDRAYDSKMSSISITMSEGS